MKKLIMLLAITTVISACSQSKTIYFNGEEGSHSGVKYEPSSKAFSLNK